MWSASVQGWAQCWPPAVSFLMLHLTCCPNQVILGTFLNTPYPHFSYPYFTELNGSYQGHSWKFTFLHIEYLLNSCPWSIVKLVQCCFLSWKIRKWKYFWIGGSFVRWLFFLHNLWFLMSFYSSIKSLVTVLIFHFTFAFGAESYKVVVVLPWDFASYLMLSLKSDFRSYMIRGTIFQLIC